MEYMFDTNMDAVDLDKLTVVMRCKVCGKVFSVPYKYIDNIRLLNWEKPVLIDADNINSRGTSTLHICPAMNKNSYNSVVCDIIGYEEKLSVGVIDDEEENIEDPDIEQ